MSSSGSWHEQYKDSAHIFVGGLPFNLTEGDIVCVLSQFGEIAGINLVRDKESGKSKGYAFLKYVDQRSTVLAVDNMNGSKIAGRVIRVDHVQNYKVPKVFDADGNEVEPDEDTVNNVAPKPIEEDDSEDDSSSESEAVDDTGIDIDDPMRDYLLKKRRKKDKRAKKSKRKSEKDDNEEDAESKAERRARKELKRAAKKEKKSKKEKEMKEKEKDEDDKDDKDERKDSTTVDKEDNSKKDTDQIIEGSDNKANDAPSLSSSMAVATPSSPRPTSTSTRRSRSRSPHSKRSSRSYRSRDHRTGTGRDRRTDTGHRLTATGAVTELELEMTIGEITIAGVEEIRENAEGTTVGIDKETGIVITHHPHEDGEALRRTILPRVVEKMTAVVREIGATAEVRSLANDSPVAVLALVAAKAQNEHNL
ncbi:hypothetical protein BGZ80_009445 [Entomortierella chlamydospora]|uniref:RRM domain-containing protein n=1 Tax=Entomortierella chlamydospora TaxID=101097 RepID=A0A9P6T0M6_9FUNG|nr:hypothetical protein BGZ80_009445 [Entomortierella chlamydospora]